MAGRKPPTRSNAGVTNYSNHQGNYSNHHSSSCFGAVPPCGHRHANFAKRHVGKFGSKPSGIWRKRLWGNSAINLFSDGFRICRNVQPDGFVIYHAEVPQLTRSKPPNTENVTECVRKISMIKIQHGDCLFFSARRLVTFTQISFWSATYLGVEALGLKLVTYLAVSIHKCSCRSNCCNFCVANEPKQGQIKG